MACHNVEGFALKLGEPDYVQYIRNFDLFCAVESWTRENFDFSIVFRDYKVFHAPALKLSKMGRLSGGVVVLVKESLLPFITEIKSKFDNIVSIKLSKLLFKRTNDIIMTFSYIPPYQSSYYKNKDIGCAIDHLQSHLLTLSEIEPNCSNVILGDLNARIADWSPDSNDDDYQYSFYKSDHTRMSKDKDVNFFAKNLIEFITILNLNPLNGNCDSDKNGEFTFENEQGSSVIDYCLLSSDLRDSSKFCFHVNTTRIESSHSPIEFSVLVKTKNDKIRTQQKYYTKLTWDPDKKSDFIEQMESEITKVALVSASEHIETNINLAIESFNSTIHKAAKTMEKRVKINTGQTTTANNKWFDKECESKKHAATTAKKVKNKSGKIDDKTEFFKLNTEYKRTRREKRLSYKRRTKDELLREKKNGKTFWSIINKARKKTPQQPDLNITEWKHHFENLLANQTENEDEEKDDPTRTFEQRNNEKNSSDKDVTCVPELDCSITEDEVREAIHNLKYSKAPGIDSICGEYLKFSENLIVSFLQKLFNKIYDNCHYPDIWNLSIITPLHKKGDINNTNNYRGISLLSVVSKVFSTILYKRLYSWAEENEKISNVQAGFRRNFSTMDHIFTLVSLIKHRMQTNKGKVYAAFIDYHKAYDFVDRERVWDRLRTLNVSTKLILMLRSMYNSVKACVRWNGELSETFYCLKGLKQGCIFSTILFSFLIDDVAAYICSKGKHGIQIIPHAKEIFALLFADDIVLISSTPQGLQTQIDNLAIKSKELGLTVNLEKTKIMVFRKGGFLAKREKWHFNGINLEIVNKFKYLGYMLTTKISFDEACEDTSRKAKMKVMDLFKTMWSLGNLDTNIFYQLFDCQIKPMLLYGSEIWGGFVSNITESAHLFALKRLLSVSDKTPNTLVYGETGRYSLVIDAQMSTIKYWLKIIKLPESRLPKQILLLLHRSLEQIDRLGKVNWLVKIRNCLVDNGFQSAWESGHIENEILFLRDLKQKLIDNFARDWRLKLVTSDRFSTYRLFKLDFGQELYLNDITIKKFRDSLIRFRLGVNDLGVNKRFFNPLIAQNMNCPFCPNVLEDEVHFLFVCYKYENLRLKYLKDCYEFENVIFLMDPNVTVIRKTAMYIYYSWKLREQILMNQSSNT